MEALLRGSLRIVHFPKPLQMLLNPVLRIVRSSRRNMQYGTWSWDIFVGNRYDGVLLGL